MTILTSHWSASGSAPINLAPQDQLWYSQDQLNELEERRMAYFQQHWQALRSQIGQQYDNLEVVSAVSYLKHVLLPAIRQPGPADQVKLEMLDIIANNPHGQVNWLELDWPVVIEALAGLRLN